MACAPRSMIAAISFRGWASGRGALQDGDVAHRGLLVLSVIVRTVLVVRSRAAVKVDGHDGEPAEDEDDGAGEGQVGGDATGAGGDAEEPGEEHHAGGPENRRARGHPLLANRRASTKQLAATATKPTPGRGEMNDPMTADGAAPRRRTEAGTPAPGLPQDAPPPRGRLRRSR